MNTVETLTITIRKEKKHWNKLFRVILVITYSVERSFSPSHIGLQYLNVLSCLCCVHLSFFISGSAPFFSTIKSSQGKGYKCSVLKVLSSSIRLNEVHLIFIKDRDAEIFIKKCESPQLLAIRPTSHTALVAASYLLHTALWTRRYEQIRKQYPTAQWTYFDCHLSFLNRKSRYECSSPLEVSKRVS